ncbi:MAG: hypothetical protein QXH58_01390, partial [Nitrososphaerales archaeon]
GYDEYHLGYSNPDVVLRAIGDDVKISRLWISISTESREYHPLFVGAFFFVVALFVIVPRWAR